MDASPSLPSGFFSQASVLSGSSAAPAALPSSAAPTALAAARATLFDGTTIDIPRRRDAPPPATSSETLDLMDMDLLFAQVELSATLRSADAALRDAPRRRAPLAALWTDKYRPHTFMELCLAGNDKQYRQVLHWLRKWSQLVFKEAAAPPPPPLPAEPQVDHLGRPLRKILLIHGPLGAGKTVVAHLLAAQQGYAVQELNAANSTDPALGGTATTASALRTKIVNALTSNALALGGRPSCLVIDEIDSAANSGDIIRVLTELVRLDARQGAKFQLNRPIICIANDVYASGGPFYSIDKLRPYCEMVAFVRPVASRGSAGNALRSLKEFLAAVCKREHVEVDYRGLSEVVEVCDGDLRSCLNYLQFTRRPPLQQPLALLLPLKDAQLLWFAIVDLLFKRDLRLSKDENAAALLDLFSNGGGKLSTASSSTVDKVVKGCFGRYLDAVASQDDLAVKPAALSDWLWFYDQMDRAEGSVLDHYAPAVYLEMWTMFSDPNPLRRHEPLVAAGLDFESFDAGRQNRATVKRITDRFPPQTRLALGNAVESVATNFAPYFDRMLTPIRRANDTKLQHHCKIARLVRDFGFELESHRDLDTGATHLHYAPELDPVTRFDNEFAPTSALALSKVVQLKRQWLFPLVRAELDRLEALRKRNTVSAAKRGAVPATADKRARITTSADFFKERYDHMAAAAGAAAGPAAASPARALNHAATRIWVKYHEGFLNAVRKNIGWGDLWLPAHQLPS